MDGTPLQNPREKAGFLSLLTFSWMSNVLKLGSKKPLEEKHLFEVEASDQAERLVADLEREWLAEKRASEDIRTKPRLWKAMMRVISFRDYATVVLIRIFYSLSSNSLPLLLWFFLRSISTASRASYSTTLTFVIGIALTSSVRMFCNTHWIFQVEVIAIRLKVATIGFVYKKVSYSSFTPNSINSNSSILLPVLLSCPPSLLVILLFLYLSFFFTSLLPSSFSIYFFSIINLFFHFIQLTNSSVSSSFSLPLFPTRLSLFLTLSVSAPALYSFTILLPLPLHAPSSISLLLLSFESFSLFRPLVYFFFFFTVFSFSSFLLSGI